MSEWAVIDALRTRFAPQRRDTVLGIGDDAAIVEAGGRLAVCTDTLVANVHFPKATPPADIGFKLIAVNLSDLAAMGAEPAWVTVSLTLPEYDEAWFAQFADGAAGICDEFDIDVIGGDTTQGSLAVSATLIGRCHQDGFLSRSGAKAGDHVMVTGTIGDASAGLHAFQSVDRGEDPDFLIQRLHRPSARLEAGRKAVGVANACIDISDGLLQDLNHILMQSQVGAVVDLSQLPTSGALDRYASGSERTAYQCRGGDDYELIFSVPPERVEAFRAALMPLPVAVVGRIVAAPGIELIDAQGLPVEIDAGGYTHFSS